MAVGTATLDFGTGGQFATVVVTGQTGILSGSSVEAFMMGDSTADNNVAAHEFVPIILRCGEIIAGTGFTVHASCPITLYKTFTVRWVWA